MLRCAQSAVCGLVLLVALAAGRAAGEDLLFVVAQADTSVRVFSRTASGEAAPSRIISGGNTLLNVPSDIKFDKKNFEFAVANLGDNTINVYDGAATGNPAPLRRIGGAATRLKFREPPPQTPGEGGPTNGGLLPVRGGLAIDAVNDEIAAVNVSSVAIFSRLANGDVAPLRVIEGPATTFVLPCGVFIDSANNEIFVGDRGANSSTPRILVFSRTANGDVAPLRTMTAESAVAINALTFDAANGEIWISDGNLGAIAYSRVGVKLRTISNQQGQGIFVDGDEVGIIAYEGTFGFSSFVQAARIYNRVTGAALRNIPTGTTTFSTPVGFALGSTPTLPSITSSSTASGKVRENFSYTIVADGGGTITYTAAPLPAGLTLVGNTISGIPTVAGGSTVTITATNSAGTDTMDLLLTIQPNSATLIDSDGDGFPDELEEAAGSSAANAGDTPFGGAGPGTLQTRWITKMAVKLNFVSAGRDSVTIQGQISPPALAAGDKAIIDVAGNVNVFTLDAKGKAKLGTSSFAVSPKTGKLKFTAKGSLAEDFADEGLVDDGVSFNTPQFPVILLLQQKYYEFKEDVFFTVKKGKSGQAKFP